MSDILYVSFITGTVSNATARINTNNTSTNRTLQAQSNHTADQTGNLTQSSFTTTGKTDTKNTLKFLANSGKKFNEGLAVVNKDLEMDMAGKQATMDRKTDKPTGDGDRYQHDEQSTAHKSGQSNVDQQFTSINVTKTAPLSVAKNGSKTGEMSALKNDMKTGEMSATKNDMKTGEMSAAKNDATKVGPSSTTTPTEWTDNINMQQQPKFKYEEIKSKNSTNIEETKIGDNKNGYDKFGKLVTDEHKDRQVGDGNVEKDRDVKRGHLDDRAAAKHMESGKHRTPYTTHRYMSDSGGMPKHKTANSDNHKAQVAFKQLQHLSEDNFNCYFAVIS